MKTKTVILFIILALGISPIAYATAAGGDTAYTVILPLEYDSISSISGNMFITRDSESSYHDPCYRDRKSVV